MLGRLCCAGFNVVDRPLPRADTDVNHGGVVVIAVLTPIAIDDQANDIRLGLRLCYRRGFCAVVVVLHRPGSVDVQQKFFDELADRVPRSRST